MSALAVQREPARHLVIVTANPLRTGGMQKFTRFLTGAALAAGWRVTIALSGENVYQDLDSGAGELHVDPTDWLDETCRGDREYAPARIIARRRWFRRTRPHAAVFVQSSNAPWRASVVGAWLARVPIVVTHRTMPWVRDFIPERRHLLGLVPALGLHNRKHVLRTRLTALLADAVVYNSTNVRGEYERVYRFPRGRGHVIANAVALPPEPAARRDPREVTIGYVGRLAPEKQVDVLLNALAVSRTRHRLRLLVCGVGPQHAVLRQLAARLGIADRIEWCGPVDDIWSAYARMDMVALCSRRESSSNAVLEAMAAGRCVIVSDVGGLPELVGDGQAGACCPVGDAAALASMIDRLADDDHERARLGARARELARTRHDPERLARRWVELLKYVARRPLAATGQQARHSVRPADGDTGEVVAWPT